MYQPVVSPPKQELSWEEAQSYCNFVLFKPQDLLLENFKIVETSLRAESSIDFASHRCVLQSPHSVLSIKQFLYDWAPPAYDHPSLWRNAKISPQKTTPLPAPLPIDAQIAWAGMNFRKQQGTSLCVMCTMIEITLVEGSVTNEELLKLLTNLKPVDSAVAKEITQTPFAMLTYMWRHKRNASCVPLSYWKYTRSDQAAHTAHLPQDIAHEGIPDTLFDHYALNSIFLTGERETPAEVEYYYEHVNYPGSAIRLLEITSPFLPKLGDQFCFSQHLEMEGRFCDYAYLTEEFGPHEAIWKADKSYLLLVKPMKWTNRAWFLDHLRALIKQL